MINHAKKQLERDDCTVAIVTADKTAVRAKGGGVTPLFFLLSSLGEKARGGFAADTVVGKGAAILLCDAEVSAVYAELMSEGAKRLFETYKIKCECNQLVPAIKNRAGDGLCPLEARLVGCESVSDGMEIVRAFVAEINGLSKQ